MFPCMLLCKQCKNLGHFFLQCIMKETLGYFRRNLGHMYERADSYKLGHADERTSHLPHRCVMCHLEQATTVYPDMCSSLKLKCQTACKSRIFFPIFNCYKQLFSCRLQITQSKLPIKIHCSRSSQNYLEKIIWFE